MQVSVNMNMCTRLWADYKRESMLNMCKRLIGYHLFKNGVQFEKNKKIIQPPPQVLDVFDKHWMVFAEDTLDSLLCLGFAVVSILEDDSGVSYPSIVLPHMYNLHYTVKNNKYEYWLTSQYLDMKKTYIYQFGDHPLPTGEIVSQISKIMYHCKFLKELRFTTLIMEKNKSNPDYFSEVKDTNKERHEGIDYDFYADASSSEDPSSSMQFDRSKVHVDVLMKQQELYHQYLGGTSKQVKNLRNITQLPSGQHVVPTSQNTGRQDVCQLHKIIQEEICSSIGVPRSLMIGDSLYKSDTDSVTDSFKHTILSWKKKIGYVFTDLYQKLYVDLKKIKVSKNIYATKQKHMVIVDFPVYPYVSVQDLDYLYKAGVIGWEVYSKQCLQSVCIPEHMRQILPPSESNKINISNIPVPNTKRKRTTG
jgi:hypothetical protein